VVKLDQPEDKYDDANPKTASQRVLDFIGNGWEGIRARSRFGKRILEAYIKGGDAEISLPIFEATSGETPLVPFGTQMALYAADPMAGSCVDFITDQIMGAGFHTTANEAYEGVAELEGGGKKTPQEIVEDYCELINMDGLLKATTKEIVGYGNSFWHAPGGDLTKLMHVPLDAVDRIFRGAKRNWKPSRGVPLSKLGYKLFYKWENARTLKPEDIIHFRFNPLGDSAFGFGILTRVCMKLALGGGKTREEFYKVYGKAQRAEMLWLEKFAKGNELWIIPEAGAKLSAYQKLIKGMPDSGARFVTDIEKADVKQVVPERARGADAYIANLENGYILAMQTPLPKLFTTPGFTEASANAAIEIAERKVMSTQRFIKRIVEKNVWWPLIDDAKLNPAEADVRLNWGMPEPLDFEALERILPIVFASWQGGAIFTWELREILRTICRLPLEETTKPEFVAKLAKTKDKKSFTKAWMQETKLREAMKRVSGKDKVFILDKRTKRT